MVRIAKLILLGALASLLLLAVLLVVLPLLSVAVLAWLWRCLTVEVLRGP
jgi:hypothetical protein